MGVADREERLGTLVQAGSTVAPSQQESGSLSPGRAIRGESVGSFTWSPTEALHHHGHAVSAGAQATYSLCRVLTTDLPAGLREPRKSLTGVGLQVMVGGCDGGMDLSGCIAAPDGTWSYGPVSCGGSDINRNMGRFPSNPRYR